MQTKTSTKITKIFESSSEFHVWASAKVCISWIFRRWQSCWHFSYWFCLILRWFSFWCIINIIYFVSMIILQNPKCHRIIATVLQQTLHRHDYIKVFCIVYQYTVNFWYAWPKWCFIFKHTIFLSFIIFICSCS